MAAASTILLLIAGRLEIPGPFSRVAVLALLALAIGAVSGHPLQRTLPDHPTDPLVIVSALILALALAAPRRWWAAGSVAFGSLLVATALYIAYLARITFVLAGGPIGLLLGLFLLAFEIAALTLMVLSVFEMIDALCGRVRLPALPDPPADWPTVAVQVPAHAEPPDLVIETVRSLVALDYPRNRLIVQVIDNNTSEEELWRPLEEECRRLGAEGHAVLFAHLEDWPGYKAGALNWATAQLPDDVEILAIVDADYVVDPDFLTASVPHFRDPDVAFVQSPQEYRDWERSAFYRACHAGLAYFFKIGMVSRALRNSIIFAGTMGLIRKASFDEIGGWDEAIITEDAEASLRMLALGQRGIFVPRAFGRGIMPLTYEGLRKQRFRWSFGGIQILRKHWRSLLPWSRSGLTQRQRRDYLLGALWWFNDLLTLGFLAFIAATGLGVIANRPFVVQLLAGPALVLPMLYLVLGLVRYLWGLRIAARVGLIEAAAALRVNLSLAWVVTLACLRALVQKEGVFLRTPKARGSEAAQSLRQVWVETSLAVAAGVLAVAVFLKAGFSTLTLTVDSLLLWSVLIYGSATDYALGDPDRPPESLRRKAALQLADGPVGKVVRPSLLIVGAAAVLVAAFVVEAGREPVQPSDGAVPQALGGLPEIALAPPGASASPVSSPEPGGSSSPAAGDSPSPAAGGSSSPAASAGPTSAASATPASSANASAPATPAASAPPTTPPPSSAPLPPPPTTPPSGPSPSATQSQAPATSP